MIIEKCKNANLTYLSVTRKLDYIKESQSTKMPCALKCFHCFVFRHLVSQFIDEILTSETYPYQSALFLDDVIFSIVEIC